VRNYFGAVRAVEVTAEMVDGYIKEKLGEEYKPASVNRGTQLLRQGFALAVERRHLHSIPSIRHLDEKDNVRQGFFEDWEFRAVESNLPDYLRDYSHFAYRTGWRKSSIANLRWEHYDGTSVRLPGKDWKNGEPQQVMLDTDLADLIERRQKARAVKTKAGVILADLIFHHDGNPIVDYRKAWKTACKLAGCPGKLFHDFCRTAIRNLDRAGISQTVAMKACGRKTTSIYQRYNIVNEQDMLTAMEKQHAYLTAKAKEEVKRQPIQMTARVQ